MRLPPTLIHSLFSLIPLASAHGRITQITTSSGALYPGWDPASSPTLTPPSPLAAWSALNLGNTYVPPSQFNTSKISCHFNALPGTLSIPVSAGEELKLQWNEWPTSHVGPVVTYLASCNGPCSNIKEEDEEAFKQRLEWVKIDELGWLNSTGWDVLELGGTWATNVLIANGYSWVVRIPEGLKEGGYVLRHEIIALHVAENLNGAQAYPQCVNLKVKGRGEKSLEGGVLGTRLYGIRDEGIFVDVHLKIDGYKIPGPEVWRGAHTVRQPGQ
jgi:cellulase